MVIWHLQYDLTAEVKRLTGQSMCPNISHLVLSAIQGLKIKRKYHFCTDKHKYIYFKATNSLLHFLFYSILFSLFQIRRGKMDNLGIIFRITPLKLMSGPIIRTFSMRRF